MINRALIRIKVIQLLYSTLLTEHKFTLESLPSPRTKESRFAYNLYLETLELFVKITEEIQKSKLPGQKKFNSKFVQKLLQEPELRELDNKRDDNWKSITDLAPYFTDKIKEKEIFKDFIDKKNIYISSENFWEEVFNTIIYPDTEYQAAYTKLPGFSPGAIDRMREFLRNTFKNFYPTIENISDSKKNLLKSLDKARELYMQLLLLPGSLTLIRRQQLDENLHKYLKTEEDLNPNLKFVNNFLVERLDKNSVLLEFEDKNVSWLKEDRNLLTLLLKEIMDSEIYSEYMSIPGNNLKDDIEFWKNIFKNVIFVSENFLEFLENQSIFWNDDIDIMGTFALKTFKKFEDASSSELILPKYKDKEAEEFGDKLFSLVLENKETYRGYINSALLTEKWSGDRLAFMDVVIILTAIAEIINFPSIPLNVTINEYIEIAKSYSSHKSGAFIHGFLGSLINNLRESGIILK